MIPSLSYGKDGRIENLVSSYQPGQEISEMLSLSTLDLQSGDELLTRPFEEFNDMSILDRASLDQKDWLAWSDSPSENPDESFMFTGTSGITRNKIISTAARLTEQVIYPRVFAQNDEDEEDQASGYVMERAVEFNCRRNNYEETFLYGVISGLVNPISYFMVDYAKSYLEILEGTASKYKRTKVLDEMFSGFRHALLPLDEVLLTNPYQFDMNLQPVVMHRRRVSYHEVKSRHKNHPDFEHVKPGIISTLNSTDSLFYNVDDTIGDGLVEETRFMYRGRDLEFSVVNGIYLSNPNVDYNPFKHRRVQKDGTTVPVYPIVKYGAEPIDAKRFYAYKSLASKLSNDKEVVDRMTQNAVDASTFAAYPSIFTMGAGKLDRSVFIPATVQDLPKDAKVSPATGFANPEYAYRAAQQAKQDINESSMDPQFSGVQGGGNKTARESILLQQNAIANLGIMGRMIAQGMVKSIGELMVDDIIRYQSVGETMELAGGTLGMKYMTMVLNEKVIDGGKKSIVIRFTDAWAGREMSKEEELDKSLGLLEEGGDDKKIYEVNPSVWIRRKYLIEVEADALKPKNDSFERTFKTELYDRAIMNPLIANDPEKLADVTRDFLFEPTVKGEGAKYIPKDTQKVMAGIIPGAQNTPGAGVAGQVVRNGAMGSKLQV